MRDSLKKWSAVSRRLSTTKSGFRLRGRPLLVTGAEYLTCTCLPGQTFETCEALAPARSPDQGSLAPGASQVAGGTHAAAACGLAHVCLHQAHWRSAAQRLRFSCNQVATFYPAAMQHAWIIVNVQHVPRLHDQLLSAAQNAPHRYTPLTRLEISPASPMLTGVAPTP